MSDEQAGSELITAERLAAVDRNAMVADLLAMPDHISDAAWRAESAFLEPQRCSGAFVVCAAGPSADAAELAAAMIGVEAARPLIVNRSAELPAWVGEDDVVVLLSYGGETPQIVENFKQAQTAGARHYVVSSGGALSAAAHAAGVPVIGLPGIFRSRVAVAYGIVGVGEIAIAEGVAPSTLRKDFSAAAELLTELAAEWAPGTEGALPARLAAETHGRLPLILGAGPTTAAARRWQSGLGANAEWPARVLDLTDTVHDELGGLPGIAELSEGVAWQLADDTDPAAAARLEAASAAAAQAGLLTRTITPQGASRAERIFSLVLLGDLTSLCLAVLRDVDPLPTPLADALASDIDGA